MQERARPSASGWLTWRSLSGDGRKVQLYHTFLKPPAICPRLAGRYRRQVAGSEADKEGASQEQHHELEAATVCIATSCLSTLPAELPCNHICPQCRVQSSWPSVQHLGTYTNSPRLVIHTTHSIEHLGPLQQRRVDMPSAKDSAEHGGNPTQPVPRGPKNQGRPVRLFAGPGHVILAPAADLHRGSNHRTI